MAPRSRARRLLAHVAVLVVCATCVALGLWQLDRLAERRAANELLLARGMQPPVEATSPSTERDAFRRAFAVGTYDTAREIVLRGRSLDGRPGHHLLTPLVMRAGEAILVDRGWIPLEPDEPPVPDAAPPPGRVRVEGVLVPDEAAGRFAAANPSGPLTWVRRIEVSRIAEQMPYRLAPLALVLEVQRPAQPGSLPIVAPIRPPGEGPHLSYALQWFSFAAIAVITYAILLGKGAKRR